MSIVNYRPSWKVDFSQEKAYLESIFKDLIIAIHHVGSTAIPTTMAKPEIDILVILSDTSFITDFDSEMIQHGYNPRGECLDNPFGDPGRYYYSKDSNGQRTHKVHICQTGHFDILDKLYFRDYLIKYPAIGSEYAQLKKVLCNEYGYRNIQAYLKGKDEFVKSVILKARLEFHSLTESDFNS